MAKQWKKYCAGKGFAMFRKSYGRRGGNRRYLRCSKFISEDERIFSQGASKKADAEEDDDTDDQQARKWHR